MRTASSIVVIAALLASAPATAQDTNPPPTSADTSNWSVLTNVHPGTEVMMTVGKARYRNRYLVGTSETEVTVLNLRDPWLPPVARETLWHLATYEPAYLLDVSAKEFAHRDVRVRNGAIFQAGDKLIDLSRMIERFPRDDVKEIKRAPRSTAAQVYGMIAGGIVGTIGLGMLGHREFEHHKGVGAILGVTTGFALGPGFGRLLGSLIDRNTESDDLIYRAP